MTHRVLLISPPWRLANWPSLALGALKAYLSQHGVAADAWHLHLDVAMRLGWDRYESLATDWELPEALFFALHHSEEAPAILTRCSPVAALGEATDRLLSDRLALLREVESATRDVLGRVDFARYDLIGFSVGALQLGASVCLSHWVRELSPSAHIVFGGSGVIGEVGRHLLECVPWVDALVDGEGERALLALAQSDDWSPHLLECIPNLHFRRADGSVHRSASDVVHALDVLPAPDLIDFFDAARDHGLSSSNLVLPIEASRGCQWEHRKGDGKLRGCTFCGLYRNSPDFRQHSLDQVLAVVSDSVRRTNTLQLGFVDAYLPSAYTRPLLRGLAEGAADVTLFCEMRCDLDEETACLLAEAGARHVQLGVEAFDTRMLGLMGKGLRMIDNLSSIKLCEEFAVPYQYNMIVRFPGADVRSLSDTLRILPSLFGYRPPSLAPFYLDRGSRIYADPERYGIEPDSLDREPLPFLPAKLAGARISQVVPFSAIDDQETQAAWNLVEREVARWQALHRRATSDGVAQLLTWRDSGAALTILDARGDDGLTYEIDGIAREVLLAADRLVHRRELARRVPRLDAPSLDAILDQLCAMRLIAREGHWLLSLPVRARLPGGAARRRRSGAPAGRRPVFHLVSA